MSTISPARRASSVSARNFSAWTSWLETGSEPSDGYTQGRLRAHSPRFVASMPFPKLCVIRNNLPISIQAPLHTRPHERLLGHVAEPAKYQVDARRTKSLLKSLGNSSRPARKLVRCFARQDGRLIPGISKTRQINFTRPERSGLPIDRIYNALVQKHIGRVEFTVNNSHRSQSK
jgi:hypothetical protein